MIWTEERTAELARLYADDYSASLIADALGNISRQAVIAKIHRMGLPRRGVGRHPTKELTADGQRTSMPRALRRVVPRPSPPPPVINISLRCVEIEPRHLSLLDLEPGDCRYPYGDEAITFCGHPKMEKTSYCVPHFHLCRGEGTASERAATRRIAA